MTSLCLYGGEQKLETIGYQLPSSPVLRTQWLISTPGTFGTEWMLNPVVFQSITQIYFAPDIDLFASRLDCQLHPFVSWKPEPGAWAINAFSICWADFMFYAFPPFSILRKVLAKVQQDGATGMQVTPLWPTQPWFPRVLKQLLQLQGKLDVLHPPSFETVSLGDSYLREALQGTGLSSTATTLICNAWREGTNKQYDGTLRRWGEFCHPRQIHPITPHVNDVVEFLSFLYDTGRRYGVIATARSTLGIFLHIPGVPVLANHPLVQKVVKGAYNSRPPAPHYVVI